MTVCVAAICDGGVIIGASDRMLTAGDVQFQPQSSKIWQLTSSIVMMMAGDIALQTEIFTSVRNTLDSRIKTSPDEWWNVSEAAELYRGAYFEIRRKRAEKEILTPLNLNSESYLEKQKAMHPDLVSQIAKELIGYALPEVAVIIAGNNPHAIEREATTSHIYVIENGTISCRDKVGFACIGIGAYHANSTFMLAGYNPSTPVSRAMLTMYSAKKRSEVAPGVGANTDNFIITSSLGSCSTIKDEIVDGLEKIYADSVKRAAEVQRKAERKIDAHIQRVIEAQPAAGQETANSTELKASADKPEA